MKKKLIVHEIRHVNGLLIFVSGIFTTTQGPQTRYSFSYRTRWRPWSNGSILVHAKLFTPHSSSTRSGSFMRHVCHSLSAMRTTLPPRDRVPHKKLGIRVCLFEEVDRFGMVRLVKFVPALLLLYISFLAWFVAISLTIAEGILTFARMKSPMGVPCSKIFFWIGLADSRVALGVFF